jgi:hypothetical protein
MTDSTPHVKLFTEDGNPLSGSNGLPMTVPSLDAGTALVNQRRLTPIDDISATVPGQAATATLTSVAASASTTPLVAANSAVVGTTAGRLGLIIVNDSATATLYLAYAATASLTSFTHKLLPGAVWWMEPPIYGGIISGIWDAAVGNARITERS